MERVGDGYRVWFEGYLKSDAAFLPAQAEWKRMDPELELLQVRNPDPNILATVHDKLYPIVYRYVRFRLEDEQVCEDITSEVFLRLLDTLERKDRSIKNLKGWLLGTASHLINDHLRLRYAHPVDTLEDDHSVDNPGLEQTAEEMWQQRRIRTAMQKLTLEQQHVLALRFSEERSLEGNRSPDGEDRWSGKNPAV